MIGLVPIALVSAIAVVLGTAASTPARADTEPPSASGQLIAFERRSGTGVADIYVIRPDGTGLRRLTRDQKSFDPAWSPDGTRITFASDRAGSSGAPEIYVMKADGSNVRRLTRSPHEPTDWRANSSPAWSPDGKRIAFVRLTVRDDSSSTDLWEVGAKGTGLRRLTYTRAVEASPTYSSGGALYFERDGAIYARFGTPPVTRKVEVGTKPAFSTSGGPLAYVLNGGVYVTYGGRGERVAAGDDPAWAPDRSRLVYAGADGLFTVKEGGTGRRRVTRTPSLVHDVAPSWRRPPRQS
jgi:hypothetical protein